MKTFKNIAKQHSLSNEEVKNIKRAVRLNTYAGIFNNYMKMDSADVNDDIPQYILSIIHNEFDDEREMAMWQDDHLLPEVDDFTLAIDYVREHIDMDRVDKVVNTLESHNIELADIDEELDSEIYDLMEEYGAENDLAEGWWQYEGTTEDIIVKL